MGMMDHAVRAKEFGLNDRSSRELPFEYARPAMVRLSRRRLVRNIISEPDASWDLTGNGAETLNPMADSRRSSITTMA